MYNPKKLRVPFFTAQFILAKVITVALLWRLQTPQNQQCHCRTALSKRKLCSNRRCSWKMCPPYVEHRYLKLLSSKSCRRCSGLHFQTLKISTHFQFVFSQQHHTTPNWEQETKEFSLTIGWISNWWRNSRPKSRVPISGHHARCGALKNAEKPWIHGFMQISPYKL